MRRYILTDSQSFSTHIHLIFSEILRVSQRFSPFSNFLKPSQQFSNILRISQRFSRAPVRWETLRNPEKSWEPFWGNVRPFRSQTFHKFSQSECVFVSTWVFVFLNVGRLTWGEWNAEMVSVLVDDGAPLPPNQNGPILRRVYDAMDGCRLSPNGLRDHKSTILSAAA